VDDYRPAIGVLEGLTSPHSLGDGLRVIGDPEVARGVAPGVGATMGLPAGLSVLVTRAPDRIGVLRCNDEVLTRQLPPPCSAAPATSGSILPGDRFRDPASGLEIVCTRAGQGALTFDGRPMENCPPTTHWLARWSRLEDGAA